VPQSDQPAQPVNDAEIQHLLEDVLDGATSAIDSSAGQAFASVQDAEAQAAGKKK
jgi:hypothetical protein